MGDVYCKRGRRAWQTRAAFTGAAHATQKGGAACVHVWRAWWLGAWRAPVTCMACMVLMCMHGMHDVLGAHARA
eukprot:360003-Chlamydomonas_euryale.AAC.4